jgi:DNA-binding IclR family transcriptional regulator
MESTGKPSAPALERGLTILEALAKSRNGLTLSQITRYLHLPKSSVFILLRTFEQFGYLYRDPSSGKYSVSLRICALASMALQGIGLRDQARPYLKKLCEESRLTVHMAVLENGSCVLIEKMTPAATTSIATWVGKHLSLHCTALGKAMAAYLPEEQVSAIVREHGLLRHNENTICSLRRLKTELQSVKQRGYALDNEEEEIGVRCIGAPIFNGSSVIGALSIVGSISEIHADNLEALARQVCAAAADISGNVRGASLELSEVAVPLHLRPTPVAAFGLTDSSPHA